MDDNFKREDDNKSFGELESEHSLGASDGVMEETARNNIQQDDVADFAQKEGQEGQMEAQKDDALESSMQQDGDIKEEAAEGATEESDGFGAVENEAEVAGDTGAQDSADAETTDAGSGQTGGITGDVLSTNSMSSEKEKKGRGRVFALAAILALVLAGCVGAYFMMQPGEEKKANQKPTKQKEEVSDYRLSGNDLSDFDLRFLQIENKEENVIYSPLSIKYALAMLKDGANGDTKKQIEGLIGDYKAKKYINSKSISLANAMFIRDSYRASVLDSYITGLRTNYNADVVYDSFTSPDTINKWVNEKTLGIINNIVSERDLDGLDYALVNALAIDQNWNYLLQCQPRSKVPCKTNGPSYNVEYAHEKYEQHIPAVSDEGSYASFKFDSLDNRKAVIIGASFNKYDIIKDLGEDKIRTKVTEEYKKWIQTEDGKAAIDIYKEYPASFAEDSADVSQSVEVYMKELKSNFGKEDSSTDFYLNDAEDAKVFAKDLKEYDGNTLQYVSIMPKEKDLKTFVSELTAEKAKGYISNLKELKKENFKDGVVTRIDAHLPLFKYSYDLALKNDLDEMGVKDVFEPSKSDLTNISKESSYIRIAKHRADIEFSNEGIKAGAATIIGGAGGGGPQFEFLWDVPVEKIDLTFDKPFVYLIRNKNSGEVWFTGTVYTPIEKK